ncbi:MAG: 6-phosphogluconolactonase [Rhizobiaceae bacterium]|nr:6-phosphogluconolactonase [Rhizobiaceae bacterium]
MFTNYFMWNKHFVSAAGDTTAVNGKGFRMQFAAQETDTPRGRLGWEEIMRLPAGELDQHSFLPVRIYGQAAEMFSALAREVADLIKRRNAEGERTVLILPVGPIRHHAELVEITNRERISWRNVVCFNMDEWMTWECRLLPLDHKWSFQGFMRRNLFARIDEDLRPLEENLHFPTPANMSAYSDMIRAAGQPDLCYAGFGYSGHIANNEPPQSRWWNITLDEMRRSRTRILALNDETLIAFAHRTSGGDTKAIPPMAVTIGMEDVLSSKRLLLISDGGPWKQHSLRVLLMHEPTVLYPCTLAQEHSNCEVWVDEKTAKPPVGSLESQE